MRRSNLQSWFGHLVFRLAVLQIGRKLCGLHSPLCFPEMFVVLGVVSRHIHAASLHVPFCNTNIFVLLSTNLAWGRVISYSAKQRQAALF